VGRCTLRNFRCGTLRTYYLLLVGRLAGEASAFSAHIVPVIVQPVLEPVNGINMKKANEYKYLGEYINENGTETMTVEKRISEAAGVCNEILTLSHLKRTKKTEEYQLESVWPQHA